MLLGLYLKVRVTQVQILRVIWTCKTSPNKQNIIVESNQNLLLIQIDYLTFATSRVIQISTVHAFILATHF